tara:strand:- start:750 stop:2438 length:1689 start_codon:yes stop_codon:yes gene_type:complete
MNGLKVNKFLIIFFLTLLIPVTIFPKDYNIKFHFYEEDEKTPANFDKIEIKIISNKVHDEKLELKKGTWYDFKKKNPLKIKHDFSNYGKNFKLEIKYAGKNRKWETVEIILTKDWFNSGFINSDRAIKKDWDRDEFYWKNEYIKLENSIYSDKNAYIFNIFFKNKLTKLKGIIVDAKNESEKILNANIKLDWKINKKLMGNNYDRKKNSATSRMDGSFIFSLNYTVIPDSLGFTPYILITRDGFVPKKHTFQFNNLGEITDLGKIYLYERDLTSMRDCKRISKMLEWNDQCMDCSCTDPFLKWYPEKAVCAEAECLEDEVKQWTRNSLGVWELECVPQFGLITSSSDIIYSEKSTCDEKIKELKDFISGCDFGETKKLVKYITENCYRECLDIPTASLIAKTLYMSIVKPEFGTSDNHIKQMVENNMTEITDLHKAIAWFQHLGSLDWNRVNIDNPVSLRAEIRYQQAVINIRIAEILIKEKLINDKDKIDFSLCRFKSNKDLHNGGIFKRDNKLNINSWRNIALNYIEKYDSIKHDAASHEFYLYRSLNVDKEFLNAVRLE